MYSVFPGRIAGPREYHPKVFPDRRRSQCAHSNTSMQERVTVRESPLLDMRGPGTCIPLRFYVPVAQIRSKCAIVTLAGPVSHIYLSIHLFSVLHNRLHIDTTHHMNMRTGFSITEHKTGQSPRSNSHCITSNGNTRSEENGITRNYSGCDISISICGTKVDIIFGTNFGQPKLFIHDKHAY